MFLIRSNLKVETVNIAKLESSKRIHTAMYSVKTMRLYDVFEDEINRIASEVGVRKKGVQQILKQLGK